MKFYKKIVTIFMGAFLGIIGLLPVNAGKPEVIVSSANVPVTPEIDEPQDNRVYVGRNLMLFATNVYDSMKNINPELFDQVKIYTVEHLFYIAQNRRTFLKQEMRESTAYRELIRRYGENVSRMELLDIARILKNCLNIQIPRLAARSKYELIKW